MPDDATPPRNVEPQATSISSISGGVNITADQATISGDVVGRDKIVSYLGYTVEQVNRLVAQISATFQPKPFDNSCPYLGLDFFTEDDARRFFGRERLVSDLLERVQTSRFVIIAGPSGSGKSSLVRAGLLHALKQGALPAAHSDRWLYTTLTPGHDPIEQLALAMSRLAKSPDAAKYMREHSAEVGALHECAESQLSDRKDQRVVIFVDQFEEVFTQISKDSDRVVFLNLLTTAATIENGRVTVLFALRSDFVTNCATYPQLYALVNQQFLLVGAMQPDELVSAIARPALEVGLRIDPDLIAQIVNDMQDEPGVLPLMQFALKDLFDAQQAKGGVIALTLDDYLARGGLRKALERHADRAFAKLNPNEQQLARSIFAGLIEIGSGHEDTRRTASFAELIPASSAAEPVKAVIQKLADARLITTAEQDRKESVTISHERLIDAWPWLRKLIDTNRESIALQNEIARDAQEWDRNQRDASYLYVGARLANAREQLTAKKIVLSGTAQAFVAAGIAAVEEARQREEARRQKELNNARKRVVVFSLIAIVAIVAATFALILGNQSSQNADVASRNAAAAQAASTLAVANASTARTAEAKSVSDASNRATAEANALAQRDEAQRQSRVALSRQLAAQAQFRLGDRLDLALLLGVQANRITNTLEARSTLLGSLQYSRQIVRRWPNVGAVATLSPSGNTLATGGRDGVTLWKLSDVLTPEELVKLPGPDNARVVNIVFNSDGAVLASRFSDDTIILWNVTDLRQPIQVGMITDTVPHMNDFRPYVSASTAFAPECAKPFDVRIDLCGNVLASSGESEVVLWDVSNPNAIRVLANLYDYGVTSLAFSHNGTELATGLYDPGKTILWNISQLKTQPPKRLASLENSGNVWSVAFSPDDESLVAGGDEGITVWDISNPNGPVEIETPRPESTSPVHTLAFSYCGKTLASGSDDHTITLWDESDPRKPAKLGTLMAHSASINSVSFDPHCAGLPVTGTELPAEKLISADSDNTVIFWNVSDLDAGLMQSGPTGVAAGPNIAVARSELGDILASADNTGVALWNLSGHNALEPQILFTITTEMQPINAVAISPNGKLVAVGGEGIVLWDMTDQLDPQQILSWDGNMKPPIHSLIFDPSSKILAAGGENGIMLWDLSNPQSAVPLRTLDNLITDIAPGEEGYLDYFVSSVTFSRDGGLLSAIIEVMVDTQPTAVILRDISMPQLPRKITPPDHNYSVNRVAFSPTNLVLAASFDDGTVMLWGMSDRDTFQPLSVNDIKQPGRVSSIVFSPDGNTLAVGNSSTISLWDVSNPSAPRRLGEELSVGAFTNMVFSSDGKTLISSGDGITLWDVDSTSWQARACQMAGRNLTRDEWRQYMGEEPYRKTCDKLPLESEAMPTPTPVP